jgi:hypothetical protein
MVDQRGSLQARPRPSEGVRDRFNFHQRYCFADTARQRVLFNHSSA